MFINSTTPLTKKAYNENNKVSFNGLRPEIAKNQLKILLTQDIWSPKLKVKMPETQLEKETLLEILHNRMKLDKFTRLTNERFRLNGLVGYAKKLINENPLHPDLPVVQGELKKFGNVQATIKTLDKKITIEANKQKPALEYFKNIEKLEEEYQNRKLIKDSVMSKFWYKIVKNNINSEGKYSTRELIDMIENPVSTTAATKKTQPATKKELLALVEKQYEQDLRKIIDVYENRVHRNKEAEYARADIQKTFSTSIRKYPDIDSHLTNAYKAVERKFMHKVDRLADVDIYPIGEIWHDMKKTEIALKDTFKEVDDLKAAIAKNSDDKKAQEALEVKEKALKELKGDWLTGLTFSVKYENINRERMIAADRVAEYDFLTGENKTIKKHKELFEYINTNKDLPESFWKELVS